MFKKGAMFGLDARIALAIFGALSVISGASLYSAIGNAKSVAILTDMREIAKAWEQYYLDTGRVVADQFSHTLDLDYLITDKSIRGWAGPYLSYSSSKSYGTAKLQYNDTAYISIVKGVSDDFKNVNSNQCSSGVNCFYWVALNKIDGRHFDEIDNIVDGGDGIYSGNFRYHKNTSSEEFFYLKFAHVD
tara:strand:- start:455 stop:1021 length:567 start_codon:yes stop_codon:yes gene_type:complete